MLNCRIAAGKATLGCGHIRVFAMTANINRAINKNLIVCPGQRHWDGGTPVALRNTREKYSGS